MMAVVCGVALMFGACTPYYQQDYHPQGAALGVDEAALRGNQEHRRDYDRYGIPPESRYDDGRGGHRDDRGGLRGDQRDGGGYREDPRRDGRQSPAPPPQDYPTAQRTANPDEVLSPYPPHHRINVEGFAPGQLAKDPENGRIFRVP